MGHLYKAGSAWRLTLFREKQRKDINLGRDYTRAKVLKASIEQAWEDVKFKAQLYNPGTHCPRAFNR